MSLIYSNDGHDDGHDDEYDALNGPLDGELDPLRQANNQVNPNVQHDLTIPLKNVNIIGYLLDNLGRINCEFTFSNENTLTINPIHYFSLSPDATICNFTMLIGTTVLRGEVQEKTQAKQTYDQAQKSGKKTALIEKISSSDYKVTVGNVEPGQTVIVSFDYVEMLPTDELDRYKFSFPTNIGIKHFSSNKTQSDYEYEKNLKKISYVKDPTYTFNFELRWISSGGFLKFESNLDSVEIELQDYLIFRGQALPLNGDINLYAQTDFKPSAYIYEEPDSGVGYVVSNVKIPSVQLDQKKASRKNFQFILDRSGSMDGARIAKAKEALKKFIKKLPKESYFNIISFGSTYSAIWSNSVPSLDFFKQVCLMDIESYGADMGGTEILNCLVDCIDKNFTKHKLDAKKTCPETYENVIIVLTDGDVGSIDKIFQTIKSKQTNNFNTRVFAIGLGTGASKQFIKGISDLTCGDYSMVGDHENLNVPIEQIFKVINKQYYTNIGLVIPEPELKPESKPELKPESKPELKSGESCFVKKTDKQNQFTNIKSVYPGKTYSFVFKIQCEREQIEKIKSTGFRVTGYNPIDMIPIEWDIEFDCSTPGENFDYSIIKQIYSNEFVRKLEKSLEFDNLDYVQRNMINKQIIELSIESNIMNGLTSFVLVDHSSEYDVGQIGTDVVVPHSSTLSYHAVKRIEISSLLGSQRRNASHDIRELPPNPATVPNPATTLSPFASNCFYVSSSGSFGSFDSFRSFGSVDSVGCKGSVGSIGSFRSFGSAHLVHPANSVALSGSISSIRMEEVDALEGGMDMFGGGGSGYWKHDYNTSINWTKIFTLSNTSNGSFKFEQDSWKLLCYRTQQEFDEHCTKTNMSQVVFFNFVILIELIKSRQPKQTKLREYFETKYPGLFDDKKILVETLYNEYINKLKTYKTYVRTGGGDY
jgi:uncharacterized protein YegL